MYNEALKEQFIKEDTTNKNFDKFMARYFKTVEKYEDEYHKDLCNFNIQEIENYFVGLSTSSLIRCQNIKAQFIKYSQYCLERNMVADNQIHWQEVDSIFLKRVINIGKRMNQFVTRKELLEDINILNNSSEAFIILGIFEGMGGNKYSDFYHLETEQFFESKGKKYIKLENNELEISDVLYELAFESATSYVRIPHSYECSKVVKLMNEPYVIKRAINSTTDSLVTNLHNISLLLNRVKNDYDFHYCTLSALTNSGRLDYIHKLVLNDKKDVKTVVKNHISEIVERYGRIQNKSDIINDYNALYNAEG